MTELTFQDIVDDGAILFLETHQMQGDRFEEWGDTSVGTPTTSSQVLNSTSPEEARSTFTLLLWEPLPRVPRVSFGHGRIRMSRRRLPNRKSLTK